MNVLFLTMTKFGDGTEAGIYTDLMRKFRDEGHDVYVAYPVERRFHKATNLLEANGMQILGVRTLNVQKTNVIEKGLGQVSLEFLFMNAIKKHFGDVKFDLITYSTPPITFIKVIEWAKRNNPKAVTYLQLKDIFPQNAVDLGMMSKTGVKGILYRWFRKKEKRLYAISDYIGCMSPANVRYVLEHNPEVAFRHAKAPIVEICPNSFAVQETSSESTLEEKKLIRLKFGLPTDKPVFFYGGNLGKPQGIPFLVECLKANSNRADCHFIVVGSGTEYGRLYEFVQESKPKNVSLFQFLPKEDYDQLANACDVGLIFLDYRFTIPNFPSRLLNCLLLKKPIIACTDPNCDTGKIAENNGFGLWAPSNGVESFTSAVDRLLQSDLKAMGEMGYKFYLSNYTDKHSYDAIMKHFD